MLVMNTGGFMSLDDTDAAFSTLQGICVEVTQKYGKCSFFNMVGGARQYTAAGLMPAEVMPQRGVDAQGGEQIALDLCHLTLPRKASVCQHVVATEKALVFEGLQNHPAPADDADMAAASKVDDEVKRFLDEMSRHTGEGADEEAIGLKMRIVYDFITEVMAHPETYFYAGVPLRVAGQTIGSFCVVGSKKPEGWTDAADLAFLEAKAAMAIVALEREYENKKRKKAQEAMMMQMMAMQQQMMQQMMMGGGMPMQQPQGGMVPMAPMMPMAAMPMQPM